MFPKTKAYADEPACSGCAFNSGNQGQLFDGAEKGKCNNTECFKKKTGHFMEEYSKAAAADYPGLRYLGIQTMDYSGGIEGMKRAHVMGGTVPRDAAKVMKEKPEKFGWCVLAPRGRGDKPTTALVCLDRKVLDRAQTPAETSTTPQTRQGPGRERENFVDAAIHQAFEEAVANTIEPRKRFDFTETQWESIFGHKPEGASDRANAQTILVQAVMNAQDPLEAMKGIGLSPHKIEVGARKAADAEWDKTHPRRGKDDVVGEST